MMKKNNYFLLLSVSPWPLISTIFSFNFLFSLLLFFKFWDYSSTIFNLTFISLSSFLWWISFSGEMNLEGGNSLIFESGIKFGMILFIASEIFFFFSFFWSYFHFFLSPCFEIGISWPPTDLAMFDFLNVPLINTVILLSSGVTVTLSHFFLVENEKWRSHCFLYFTISLGFLFTLLQLLEYQSSFFSISDSSFGTSFFVLTGFHGIHVLIGSLFLVVSLIRSFKMSSTNSNFLGFELASWYWHFVDVIWIFLYFLLYYLNG